MLPRLDLFPNPTSGELYPRGLASEPTVLRILDLHGRVLRTLSMPSFDGVVPIATEDLPAGLLWVEWQTRQGTAVGKVVMLK